MSETTLFGDDSMEFKSDFSNDGRVVAEAYKAVANRYGDSCNDGDKLKDLLQPINSALGAKQGSLDNIKKSEIDEFQVFPTESYKGHQVPEGMAEKPEATFDAEMQVSELQGLLSSYLAAEKTAPAGNSGPEPEPESNDSSDSSESDMEAPLQALVNEVEGIGKSTADNFRRFLAENPDWEAPDVSIEIPVTEQFDSLDEVVVSDEVSLEDLSEEQRQAIAA